MRIAKCPSTQEAQTDEEKDAKVEKMCKIYIIR